MKKIYLIPGLGADESVFADYDFPGFQKVVIEWLEFFENESLESYARRLIPQLDDDTPLIVGVSFGGMVAMELGNAIPKSTIFLISSVSSYRQISSIKRFLAASGIIKLFPNWLLTKPNWLLFWLFGVRGFEDKAQLATIIRNTSPEFLKWAVGAIGQWRGSTNHEALYRIHGSRDRLLPLKGNADQIIKGGGHFMVVDRAFAIEKIIRSHFNTVL